MRHPEEGTGHEPGGAGPGGTHLDEGTIHAWLDGALDAAESARVERHSAACAACAALVAEARGLVAAASRILTRLDDVPAGVVPAVVPASVASEGPRPVAAAPHTRGRDARRPRRWTPAAWGLSTAAAAAIVMIVVAREVVQVGTTDRATSMESAAPITGTDSALSEASAPPPTAADLAGTSGAPDTASGARAGHGAFGPRVIAPAAPRRVVGAGAAVAEAATVTADSVVAPTVSSSLQGRAAGVQIGAGAARAEADRAVPIPAPGAGLAGIVRQDARREAAEKLATSDAAAESASTVEGFVAVPQAANAAVAPEEMRFRVEPSADSATRAALPRRLGLGSRILSGARLVSSAVDTTARPIERRSIYALEDGAIVTLVERASIVALEAVVTTSARESERARQARPTPSSAAAAPAQPPAGAAAAPTAPGEVRQESSLADGSRLLRPAPGETVLVRPDGLVRLEWREIGVELSLEGRISIDRIRALKARVGH